MDSCHQFSSINFKSLHPSYNKNIKIQNHESQDQCPLSTYQIPFIHVSRQSHTGGQDEEQSDQYEPTFSLNYISKQSHITSCCTESTRCYESRRAFQGNGRFH